MNIKNLIAVLFVTLWVGFSEFIRNQFLILHLWQEHYQSIGLTFPVAPVNGAIWGLWSLIFAIVIVSLSQKFNLIQTMLLVWTIGFVMMWIVIGNLAILPFSILPIAIPLSMFEAGIASWIAHRMK